MMYTDIQSWFWDWYASIYLSKKYKDVDLADIGLEILHRKGEKVYGLFFPFLCIETPKVNPHAPQPSGHYEKGIRISECDDTVNMEGGAGCILEDIDKTHVNPLMYIQVLKYTEIMLEIYKSKFEKETNADHS